MTLGEPARRSTLVEFGDLKCPVCKAFSEEVIPQVIESKVRGGSARIEFRNYTIIDAESTPAGAAAIAAGEQGRGWDFVELFYRNQGNEPIHYVTDEFLTAIATKAGVPDIARWNRERKSKRILAEVARTTRGSRKARFRRDAVVRGRRPGDRRPGSARDFLESAGNRRSDRRKRGLVGGLSAGRDGRLLPKRARVDITTIIVRWIRLIGGVSQIRREASALPQHQRPDDRR